MLAELALKLIAAPVRSTISVLTNVSTLRVVHNVDPRISAAEINEVVERVDAVCIVELQSVAVICLDHASVLIELTERKGSRMFVDNPQRRSISILSNLSGEIDLYGSAVDKEGVAGRVRDAYVVIGLRPCISTTSIPAPAPVGDRRFADVYVALRFCKQDSPAGNRVVLRDFDGILVVYDVNASPLTVGGRHFGNGNRLYDRGSVSVPRIVALSTMSLPPTLSKAT